MFFSRSKLPILFLLASILSGVSAQRAVAIGEVRLATAERDVLVNLKPLPDRNASDQIVEMEVELIFGGVRASPAEPLVRLALVADNVDSVATVLSKLTARDDAGPLRLRSRDVDLPVELARDSETGGPTREWYADRITKGRVRVSYTVPAIAVLPPRGPAGPLEFRNDGGALSAAGNVFLLMPPGNARYRATIGWDLSALPAGARGISSLGEGRVASAELLTSGQLRMSYFMAGSIGGLPDPAAPDRFFAAWQGTPPFDAAELMTWTGELHARYRSFFGEASLAPYGVFLRFNPVNAGGGTGLHRSFVATYGNEHLNSDELKIMLSHEMFHTFQPFLSEPAGKGASWFGEGLAMFYGGALPYRFGMISSDQYILDVNFSAARYYSNSLLTLPNSAVGEGFWKDTRIRTLAYDRGLLYFASVDDAVRKATNGRRSLDDLMLAMLRTQHANGTLTVTDWEALLRETLGNGAVAEFRAYLDGKMPLPPDDAFGPCFSRTTIRVRRYELGFEPAVLAEQKRIVRGLVAGSNAEAAGLRNGDEIMRPVPQDSIQGRQGHYLQLDVSRGGRSFRISYLPRGEEAEVYQWVKKPKQC